MEVEIRFLICLDETLHDLAWAGIKLSEEYTYTYANLRLTMHHCGGVVSRESWVRWPPLLPHHVLGLLIRRLRVCFELDSSPLGLQMLHWTDVYTILKFALSRKLHCSGTTLMQDLNIRSLLL